MGFPQDQLDELKKSFPEKEILMCDEGGVNFLLIPAISLPDGWTPSVVDLLFCPIQRDGYPSRLYFSEKITGKQALNWNTTTVILGRTWYAFSWRIDANQSLLNSIFGYLKALK